MKLYYCENLAYGELEHFFIVDTGLGMLIEFEPDEYCTTWESIEQFKRAWDGHFGEYAQVTLIGEI